VYQWTPANEDNFRVLTATDRTQRGKEFDDLKAGVFTYHLYRALTEPELWVADETGVIDSAGIIWIDRLSKWLRVAIDHYGKGKQRKVPDLCCMDRITKTSWWPTSCLTTGTPSFPRSPHRPEKLAGTGQADSHPLSGDFQRLPGQAGRLPTPTEEL